MDTKVSGRVLPLTRSDDCECDECGKLASLRLEEPGLSGITVRDFCNGCYRDYTYEKSELNAKTH